MRMCSRQLCNPLPLAAATLLLSLSAAVSAEEETGLAVKGRLRKLGRGIANVATCPAELLRTPELVGRREGYIAASTVGVAQGAWRVLQRGATGLFEVATFYAEIPEGYGPLMRPEFVWENGNWVVE